MREVRVTVELKGKRYQTNVIVNEGMSDTDIQNLAEQQVLRQLNK